VHVSRVNISVLKKPKFLTYIVLMPGKVTYIQEASRLVFSILLWLKWTMNQLMLFASDIAFEKARVESPGHKQYHVHEYNIGEKA